MTFKETLTDIVIQYFRVSIDGELYNPPAQMVVTAVDRILEAIKAVRPAVQYDEGEYTYSVGWNEAIMAFSQALCLLDDGS